MRNSIKVSFLVFFSSLGLISCEGDRTSTSATIIEYDSREHGKGFKWKHLTYSDGTYGAEVNGVVVLSGCPKKIYSAGYNGCYMFKTQKGKDKYIYDINGNEMFHINGIEFLNVMPYMTNDILKNGFLLVTDFDDNTGVYNLDGEKIISPQFASISVVYSYLGNDEHAIWGFNCEKRNDRKHYIYDWNGNFIFSGESLYQPESHGVLPTFVADENGVKGLYNHKGERILREKDYYSYCVKTTSDGMTYIVLETYEDMEREYADCKWIDTNGNTLKPVDGNRNNSLWNENREITQRAKRELRENMRTIQKSRTPNNIKHSTESSNTSNYGGSTMEYINSNVVIEPDVPNNNSKWEQHYKSTYYRYENRVIDLINTLNTLQSTGNGGATSSYAISDTKASIRNMQSEMQRIRNEAQQYNVYISVSPCETAGY